MAPNVRTTQLSLFLTLHKCGENVVVNFRFELLNDRIKMRIGK